jgi:hypothetical protein
MYRLYLQNREIRERGKGVGMLLQTEMSVENKNLEMPGSNPWPFAFKANALPLYTDRKGVRVGHMKNDSEEREAKTHAGFLARGFFYTEEAIGSSETSVHTRFILRHIPGNGILQGHRRENLKSYKII